MEIVYTSKNIEKDNTIIYDWKSMPKIFNEAPEEVQDDIGQQLAYGPTLKIIMKELRSDEIIDGLFLGTCGDAGYIPFRMNYGITHLVNVAAECQPPANPEGMTIKQYAWRDGENQGKAIIKNGFKDILNATEFIDDSLKNGHKVMVHCVQGVSRSSSLVIAFLMFKRGMSIEDAKNLVKTKHPTAHTNRFNQMLIDFNYYLQSLNK